MCFHVLQYSLHVISVEEEREGAESRGGNYPQRRFTQNQSKIMTSFMSWWVQQQKSAVWKVIKLCLFFPKICERSTSPRWDEAFYFLVRDPRDETLTVKVRLMNSSCISTLSKLCSCKVDKMNSYQFITILHNVIWKMFVYVFVCM